MSILDRIKKRQLEGFKEFVQNMEITAPAKRQQILTAAILEDPIYMTWVMKNTKSFDDFLALPSQEIEAVLNFQEQVLLMFAKSLAGSADEKVAEIQTLIPKHSSRFKEEYSYLGEVTLAEKESARYFIVKTARKLQHDELILGFNWQLPPMELFYPKVLPDGETKIFFESGQLAAEGAILKGRRFGSWQHFYDNGKLLAMGDYLDGMKAGTWAFYYGNGSMKSQGKYRFDTKIGSWREWDRDGNVSEVEYKEGVKVG